MSKHTPGPWPIKVTGDRKRIRVGVGLVDGPRGYDVAEVYSDDCDGEEAEANAHLIAAAPDLLDALCVAADYLNGNGWEGDPRMVPIEAAIAKAKGENDE
jgi:hypothetical protein